MAESLPDDVRLMSIDELSDFLEAKDVDEDTSSKLSSSIVSYSASDVHYLEICAT